MVILFSRCRNGRSTPSVKTHGSRHRKVMSVNAEAAGSITVLSPPRQ